MNKRKLSLVSMLLTTLGILLFISNTNTVKAESINDYIINNKVQPAAIQNREGTFGVWSGYENGVGKPEGVVIHETAMDNTDAETLVASFNNIWKQQSVYVHAFVDDKEIINIHNTDYIVWGAGATANSKFIQVELCRVPSGDYDKFTKSIVNQAYYAASKLLQYNLPDTPGVTVMSHHQTSLKWKQTDHVDPDTYFPTWGYSMDQMNDLISYFYNNLKNTGYAYGTNETGNSNGVDDKAVIKTKNANGSFVPLVAFNDDGSVTNINNRGLGNDTFWQTDQTRDLNGVTYRRVATNEWVDSQYIVG